LVAAAALVASGCGSDSRRAATPGPRLPAALAARLASESDRVAGFLDGNDGCAALAEARALQRQTVAAINAGRVPARLQEPLSGAANDLVGRIRCVPPRPEAVPVPEPADGEGKQRGHGHVEKHGKGHGKEKHGHGGGDD
jgi:hypothetical protein